MTWDQLPAIAALLGVLGKIVFDLRSSSTDRIGRTLDHELSEEQLELEERVRRDAFLEKVGSVYTMQIESLRKEVDAVRAAMERAEKRAREAEQRADELVREADGLKIRVRQLERALEQAHVPIPD